MLKLAPALLTGFIAMGGWAVVTVKDLPEYFVAGQQYTIEFQVRQHGRTLLSGLRPELVIERGDSGCRDPSGGAIGRGDLRRHIHRPRRRTGPIHDQERVWQQPAASLPADCGRRRRLTARPGGPRSRPDALRRQGMQHLPCKQRSDRPSGESGDHGRTGAGRSTFGPRIRRPESEESGVTEHAGSRIERRGSGRDRGVSERRPRCGKRSLGVLSRAGESSCGPCGGSPDRYVCRAVWSSDRHGPASPGPLGGRRRPPGDVWRRCGAGCAA